MPRFVILTHDHPFLHWDFMLEQGEVLRTWRLLQAPTAEMASIPAESLPDHRLHYLDYEGPVGGNRGEVRRWDQGRYTPLDETPERIRLRLEGAKLNGVVELARESEPGRWTLLLEPAE